MRYITARQSWHDAFSGGIAPDETSRLLHVNGGNAHDHDSQIWHEIMAGKVQNVIAKLPAELQAWGHLCFSPDNIRNPRTFHDIKSTGVFQTVQDEVWRQFQLTDTYDGTKSVQQSIVVRYAIENMMHLQQHGAMPDEYYEQMRPLYTQAFVMDKIAKGKNEWRREGYRSVWVFVASLLHDWTGRALGPVATMINEFEEKQEAAYEAG